ncbi:MAG: hypothetical protein QOE14_3090 [Humisphaera sp.]|nr:hypothetical protein [Humisphaera sp.]
MNRFLALAALVVIAVAGLSASPAHAAIIDYYTTMSGPNEAPPNASLGTGSAHVTYDSFLHTMRVEANFTGLSGTTTASHIHAATAVAGTGTAGVATQTPSFSGFPLGVTSGTMDTTFDLTLNSSWNPSYITNNGGTPASAEAAFFNAMNAGKAYFNIHTTVVPGGEIRGFMVIPEPGALTLLGAGAVLAMMRRRRAA